jgi:hypothetical protein
VQARRKLVDGPIVLDVVLGATQLWIMPAAQDCSATDPSTTGGDATVRGGSRTARIYVKSGEQLCALYNGPTGTPTTKVQWSGFRPY